MAHLFLDGFPMELLDGDAGCIPIDWVTDVFEEVNNILLGEVNNILKRDPRIFVLSVLGVQSSGKSTLLNTMFGLQFAVSSGRCTRGAFMQLLRIDNELTEELGFEFILVIDTEGLKALELATLENSYEHDNELATLGIGIGNATILNVKMENAEEMKDILQIVVHAFLRMTEGGKKPSCVFVHQNSGGVSAHEKNKQDQERLLQILNEMTEAAAKMEEKSMYYKRFTDVIDYDAENDKWYIPGLRAGGSYMARVNCTYSDEVWKLKKHLLEKCKKNAKLGNIYTFPEISGWIKTMWTAMKKETYVFHFRNFLVLEAYNMLCSAYTGWELNLRMNMISWMQNVSNKVKRNQEVADLLEKLKSNLIKDMVMKFDFLQVVGPHTLENPDKIKEFKKEVCEGIKRVSSEIMKDLCGLENLNTLLDEMPVKPHEEIFKTVSGCGQLCPLCKAPCDRGGSAHREHGAAMHYPQGLCGRKCSDGTLIVNVCTTSVAKSKYSYLEAHSFTNEDTKGEWYEYRNYREVNDYYKSWDFPPGATNLEVCFV
ncbi:LOW QUALITY PROTEIN: interferon-induced very large GTPase 1-like [Lethenteron reissneri]|uniref:LOW QUALITY PROTEIN: interferon-induced very large GTPase 1-like n=1 Tax=Lethenteron reissneri TaxID=7753 RepID=UPI002AB6B7FE|nr:LOW QUALITY PROTEIN: interferon-induced very large GTPase 1-like [Lethenteron reissneri]